MENGVSPQFQSFQGLHQVITTQVRMRSALKELLEWVQNNHARKQIAPRYQSVRLLDTFLSDSLDEDILESMLELAKDHSFEMKILVLDPLSQIAQTRARALRIDPVEEINKTLFSLRNAMHLIQGKRSLPDSVLHEGRDAPDFVLEQLDRVKVESQKGKFNLAVRFYELLTEVPSYIISQFVAKGLIVHGHTAAHNPWMILVDDETQSRDLYDLLSQNFDSIWDDDSKLTPTEGLRRTTTDANRGVFISHGHNRAVALELCKFVKEKLDRKPVLFEDHAKASLTIVENLEVIAGKSSSAIVILTKEDGQQGGGVRARQNVIHELGYCQALYGRERVILVLEEGVEIPSNISGMLYTSFEGASVHSCYEFLREHLG